MTGAAEQTTTGWGVRNEVGDVIAVASEFQARESARRQPEQWTPVRRTVTYGPWEYAAQPVDGAAPAAPHRHTCPSCSREVGTGFGGVSLMPHKDDGEPCPGSRTPVADLATPADQS